MQRETSNDSFLEYGQTYHEPIRLTHPDLIHHHPPLCITVLLF